MQIAVVCCSLNPESRSSGMAERVRQPLADAGAEVDWIDLRDHPLPLCDGGEAHSEPAVIELGQRLEACDAILLAVPIYNYDGNAAAKNLIELTGKAWDRKIVGFICSAGGRGSFMSVMPLANSLMLDFRCLVVPRFVYADDSDFNPAGMSDRVDRRLVELAKETFALASAVGTIAAW